MSGRSKAHLRNLAARRHKMAVKKQTGSRAFGPNGKITWAPAQFARGGIKALRSRISREDPIAAPARGHLPSVGRGAYWAQLASSVSFGGFRFHVIERQSRRRLELRDAVVLSVLVLLAQRLLRVLFDASEDLVHAFDARSQFAELVLHVVFHGLVLRNKTRAIKDLSKNTSVSGETDIIWSKFNLERFKATWSTKAARTFSIWSTFNFQLGHFSQSLNCKAAFPECIFFVNRISYIKTWQREGLEA